MSEKPDIAADVLILTVTDVEVDAVLDRARAITGREAPLLNGPHRTYHDLGVIGDARTLVVQCEMGGGSPGGALATVITAIDEVRPEAVLAVGIAFGVDPDKQPIGTVLVSQQMIAYELQRRSDGGMHIPRGDRATASPRVLNRLRSVRRSVDIEVKFIPMLSGDKLVDDPDYRSELLQRYPEAEGGEMEGHGLYAAAIDRNVRWAVVKAVCDHADGHKRKDKKVRQQTAATNAALFALTAIEAGGFAPDPP